VTPPDPRWDVFVRAEHVLLLLFYSTSATAFAIALWVAASWLAGIGQTVLAGVLVGAYVILSLPILAVQLGVVGDAAFVFVTRTAVVVPALRRIGDDIVVGWPLRVLSYILTAACPFAPLSTWAWTIVLPSTHARELAGLKHRSEAAVMAGAWRRLRTFA
jgi:hypothetical protein